MTRRNPKPSAKSAPGQESIEIVSGKLGPLGPQKIEIYPLTVFIGKQGTGKSLIAQMLFLFRALGDLVKLEVGRRIASSRKRIVEGDTTELVAKVIDGLRSGRRRFANLTQPNATIAWRGRHALTGEMESLRFNAQFATRAIAPTRSLLSLAKLAAESRAALPFGAMFVPTERLLFSMLPAAELYRALSLPLIFESFASELDRLWDAAADASPDVLETPRLATARDRLKAALGGEIHRTASNWRWKFNVGGDARALDLDMASSGQRSSGYLDTIALGLLALRARKKLGEGFTLYLEEPEIHLHPDAERLVVELLSVLVANGIRVVLTTHSLTVLYAVNNLLLRSKLADSAAAPTLSPGQTQAYLCDHDGKVTPLLDRKHGFIDEQHLGGVADTLLAEMNSITQKLRKQGAPP
jgi:hypothetical protein